MSQDTYGAGKNKQSLQQSTRETKTGSFRRIVNGQDDSVVWGTNPTTIGKDVPKYWIQDQEFSIDSGYSSWNPGNLIYIGSTSDTPSSSSNPPGVPDQNKGASSRYNIQWTRVGGVVTGSGRVNLGVGGYATSGTGATWLQYNENNTISNGSECLTTNYDRSEVNAYDGTWCVASIPLPVYTQTNVNIQTGAPLTPLVGSRADLTRAVNELTSSEALGLRGARQTSPIDGHNKDINGAGTVVGQFYNGNYDETNGEMKMYFPNGDFYQNIKNPYDNVCGTVNFSYTTAVNNGEDQSNNKTIRFMNIVVKSLGVPTGQNLPASAINKRAFSGLPTKNGLSVNPNAYRYILPPIFHFTFSYALGDYGIADTIS